ncbi:zinc finger E-box-binding homeobox protein zag-1-like [Contarinia nasturtii]|uniref:zinc finger E-box-binding homeobox protein zag-1-like n=1 Tax=Contarinia nasturtii TaxID=265458 RepID=UPI0012D44F2D|nr:zinc finger E-box-binding homeobox protein zag-1-like [Contarinia nasturtii]
MIRFGGNVYILHNAITCVKKGSNSVGNSESIPDVNQRIGFENIQNFDENSSTSGSSMSPTCCVEEVYIKIEPIEENEQPNVIDESIAVAPVQSVQNSPHNSSESSTKLHTENKVICLEKPKQVKRNKKNESSECDVCGKILSNQSTLRRHKIIVHSSRGSIFCKVCARVFSSAYQLTKHKIECILKRRNDGPALEDISFECYICKAKFKTKRRTIEHIRWKHDPQLMWHSV